MNVVFDLGNVVFAWRPESLLRQVFDDAGVRDRVRQGILEHHDWVDLDRGSLSLDDAIDRGASRTGLSRDEVATFLNAVPPSLTPNQETIDLNAAVRTSGNGVYVLSNMHHASIDYLEREHAIWNLFDGAVISCRVNKVKPDLDIYEHLLAQHCLDAAATVFIDDLAENVVAARKVGIHPIQFTAPAQCRRELRALGCL